MVTQTQRDELAVVLDCLHDHREKTHYPPVINGVIRRQLAVSELGIKSLADLIKILDSEDGLVVDCSQMVIVSLAAVGIHVPHPDGFTGTLLSDLKPHYTDARGAYIGAVAIYGEGTGHHATITRHRDIHQGNPVQFSHGGNGAFASRYISLLTEAANQPHPVTMLSIANL